MHKWIMNVTQVSRISKLVCRVNKNITAVENNPQRRMLKILIYPAQSNFSSVIQKCPGRALDK